jgi:hypothetical protein
MHPTVKSARIAGALYLLLALIGIFDLLYVPSVIIVHGNATATANNILAHEGLFRVGIAADMISGLLFIIVAVALYRLLSDVNKSWAAIMVALVLISVTAGWAAEANNLAALSLVHGADFLSVFEKSQRDALAMLFLVFNGECTLVNEIFWGLWLLPFGALVMKSGFLPRLLGAWLIINGIAYVAICFTGILAPQFSSLVLKVTSPVLFGEIAIALWLLIMGAKVKPADAAAT